MEWKTMFTKGAPKAGWFVGGALVAVLVVPRPAHAQFGIDIAVILAGLEQVNKVLSSAVAGPLGQIQAIEKKAQDYQQQVMYPLNETNNAKSMVGSLMAPMQQMTSLLNVKLSSASMPNTQHLEQLIMSGDPNQFTATANSYIKVYGELPSATAAPPEVRSTLDMTDAQAQDAMKKAMELDALAARELEVAQSLTQQIQSAAPGTAPILEAEGSAWVLQANAYSQSALAALLRVRTAELSSAGSDVKNRTTQTQQMHKNLLNILGK